MGRLFIQREKSWDAHALRAGASLLLKNGAADLVAEPDSEETARQGWQARVCCFEIAGITNDILLLRKGVPARINGHPVVGELAVLKDRSVLSIDSQHVFYSSESPAEVEIFHPGKERINCARCAGEVLEGEVVRCQGCNTVFHQSQDRPCYTYGDTCPVCNTPTALGEEGWTPDLL